MQAWGEWLGKLGPALVDGGNPTSQSRTVDPGRRRVSGKQRSRDGLFDHQG